MKGKYLKFMPFTSVANASRNRRELSVAAECGFDTYCYSNDKVPPDNIKDDPFIQICSKFSFIPLTVKPRAWRWIKVFQNCRGHAKVLKSLNMDVISCHNVRGLAVAWYAYKFTPKSKRPKLIYDSHEFELEKRHRSKFGYKAMKWLEGFLIKRATFTIIVCETPADWLQEMYHLKDRPIVLRSIPPYWQLNEEEIKEVRQMYFEKLGISDDSFIVIYTGLLTRSRGLEEIIKAMEINKDFYAVWLGEPNDEKYAEKLEAMVEKSEVGDRILRHPLVPQKELWKYVGAADASMIVMDYTTNGNYQTALPNKFFEAIQSGTPSICADSLEMTRMVEKYHNGLLVPAANPEALAEVVDNLKKDRLLQRQLKENVLKAKEELCWEKEKNILKEAFKKYL